ncbi:hypothetical protein KCU73_g7091, partial [Aureobasidium melanogenum]
MKQQLIILAFALVVLVVRPAVAGNNDGPPGTNGQHVTYDCGGDPMGCQNMCYYYYCLGRSNYLTHLGNADKDKAAGKKIQANRSGSGYRWRIFGLKRRTDNGFNVLSNAHTTPDEYPPASVAEGGEGASLVGHDTRQVQGGKIGRMWAKLNGNTGWVEPFNWDPARSPACNCKPNWPEHTFHNPYGDQCDCGNDPMRKYIYRMTKNAKRFDKSDFQNWDPHPGWNIAGWNFLGFSKMKRDLKSAEVAKVQTERETSSEGFETKVRCAATPA